MKVLHEDIELFFVCLNVYSVKHNIEKKKDRNEDIQNKKANKAVPNINYAS